MIGLSTERAPSPNVVIPHFIYASLAFLVLCVLLLFNTDSLLLHFSHPRVLALTHIAALGWITMLIFGSLYQLIPVVYEVALFSEKLARINFWLFGVSIIVLCASFWYVRYSDWLSLGGSLMFISIVLFVSNVILSIRKSPKKNFGAKFVTAAMFWLLSTAFLGLLLALNHRYSFFAQYDFNYLKSHAHFGLIGWLLMLVMGVASILIPMFLVSHKLDERKLKRAFYAMNLGLVLLSADWLIFRGSAFQILFLLIVLYGIFNYTSFIYDSYRNKLRKLDIGMRYTMLAFTLLILPVIFALILSMNRHIQFPFLKNVAIVYGLSIFFGFYTNMILGQTYKTLPFIIWLHRYKSFVGKAKTPMPRELYHEKIANIQFFTYLLSLATLLPGVLFNSSILLNVGAGFLLITAILYNINVFSILFVRKEVKPLNRKA